jgi:hypothetical protein
MTAFSHEPARVLPERQSRSLQLVGPEMWASLAIIVMWLAVLLDALFGPNIVSASGVGEIGDRTTVPSAVVVALFAFLATWVVARYGFRQDRKSD